MSGATGEEQSALPRPLRTPVAVLIGVALLVFVVLAVRYAGYGAAGWLDRGAGSLVDSVTPDSSRPATVVVSLGEPFPVVVTAVLLAVLCLYLGRRRLAVLAIAGPGLTGLATTGLKPVIGRTINGSLAFPSGHTAAAAALGLVVALIVISVRQPSRWGGMALLASGGLAAGGGMALALLSSGIHYPTDTIGGFCTAVAVVLGAALIVDQITGAAGTNGTLVA